ncbi:DNA cytosine methyltransferase [Empedobacter falsenii]|uniref:DNA cytosine methyltransferase n=1 Tax=Empedobacter falsenii TaxID=343874 RepID=UPI003A80410C
MNLKELNFIDLFAGAGGLSEGFIRAGYKPIAHVEMNKDACDTIKTRTVFHYLKDLGELNKYEDYLRDKISRDDLWSLLPETLKYSVINKEISKESLNNIIECIDNNLKLNNIKNDEVDLIIGGPPCQAYSLAGRARDPKGMIDDPRNYLYKYYIDFLKYYKPKMFVFENVPGILSAKNGEHLAKIFKEVEDAGYELSLPKTSSNTLNSKNFNVLQNRKRVIIIGWRKELKLKYPDFPDKEIQYEILKDLFNDLPKLQNGQGSMGVSKYVGQGSNYMLENKLRGTFNFVTQHYVRPTNENDREIYRIAVEHWNDGKKRLNYSKLPSRLIKHKNINSFVNRFQVVDGTGISHTVVAHISMDGHYYIHPDIEQNRSISVREAARIQSFPDDYHFEGSRTAILKQIGNAVPVLMAEGIANKIKELIS